MVLHIYFIAVHKNSRAVKCSKSLHVHKYRPLQASAAKTAVVAMEAVTASTFSSLLSIIPTIPSPKPVFSKPFKLHVPKSCLSSNTRNRTSIKLNSATFSTVSTEPKDPIAPKVENEVQKEKFDWYSHWYPVMPLCDLDKKVPHAKKVLGIDIVVWWDRNEEKWQVFDDKCPHRLAPLSEGRIDQWGRLQCVYHGWCFNGSGDCKFIPQAPTDGPAGGCKVEIPIEASKKVVSIQSNGLLPKISSSKKKAKVSKS
ncbi:hypothetical protein IFM89_038253 [Coptis chinensis]|uniref:Rieske domain-containing protein n=1 Tax=Coptis chinensis TaxID=261450 RepID=A0A835H7T8_9MAGN|nr:hypothetical protein IFM89_038253 [Coptis chinensis]